MSVLHSLWYFSIFPFYLLNNLSSLRFYLFKEPTFVFNWFSLFFYIVFCSFLLFCLLFNSFYFLRVSVDGIFSIHLSCRFRLFECFNFYFSMCTFKAMYFPLGALFSIILEFLIFHFHCHSAQNIYPFSLWILFFDQGFF